MKLELRILIASLLFIAVLLFDVLVNSSKGNQSSKTPIQAQVLSVSAQ